MGFDLHSFLLLIFTWIHISWTSEGSLVQMELLTLQRTLFCCSHVVLERRWLCFLGCLSVLGSFPFLHFTWFLSFLCLHCTYPAQFLFHSLQFLLIVKSSWKAPAWSLLRLHKGGGGLHSILMQWAKSCQVSASLLSKVCSPLEEVPAAYFLRFAKCFVASLWFLPQIWWQHIVCIYWWFVSTCCILGFVEIPCFIFLGNVHLHFWFCYLLAFSVFVWRFGKIKKQGTNTSPSIFTYVIIIWLLLHLLLWLTLKCKKINIFQLIKMEFWRQTLSKVLVCRELIWK